MNWCCYVVWMCKQTRGKCAWISVSVHKWRVIRRWAENVKKMYRNRGNVIDLLTGKISATTPPLPPPTESDPVVEITENFCYYPPPHWMRSAPGEMTENKCTGWPPQTKILATPLHGGGSKRWTFQKRWTFSDNRDFTVCIIRCVYHAQLILGT